MESISENGLPRIMWISIESIVVPDDGRILDEEHLAKLDRSIKMVGLLHPITITRDHRLLAGRDRLAVCKRRGHTGIWAYVVDCTPNVEELITIEENLVRRGPNYYELTTSLARQKKIYEELHPETRHGGRRAAGQTRNGAQSFINDTAERVGPHRGTISKLTTIGSRLIPLPPALSGHPSMERRKQVELLSRQPGDVQQVIMEMVVSGEAGTVAEAVAARNGHHGADSGQHETEVLPDTPHEATEEATEVAEGPEGQVGAAPTCSVGADQAAAPVAAPGEQASDDLPPEADCPEVDEEAAACSNGHGMLTLPDLCLREGETLRSKIDAGLDYVRLLVEIMEGPPEIHDGLKERLDDTYRAHVGRNGRERPPLPSIRSTAP